MSETINREVIQLNLYNRKVNPRSQVDSSTAGILGSRQMLCVSGFIGLTDERLRQ